MQPALGEDGDGIDVGVEQLVQRADRPGDAGALRHRATAIRLAVRDDDLVDGRVGCEERDELLGERAPAAQDADLHQAARSLT
jgi:hypothetical protein